MKPIGSPVLHRFKGGGLTGYLLLESSITFHTCPEHRFLALDIFSCGSADLEAAAFRSFVAALEPGREHLTMALLRRGDRAARISCDDEGHVQTIVTQSSLPRLASRKAREFGAARRFEGMDRTVRGQRCRSWAAVSQTRAFFVCNNSRSSLTDKANKSKVRLIMTLAS